MSRQLIPTAFLLASTAFAASALAHHGWNWADEAQTELSGTIQSVAIVPPHPRLDVDTGSDGVWRVELGNPSQTKRSGFVEGSARPGDKVSVTGNRARDHSEKRMKAVQITVEGKTYDIYPDRIKKRD